MFRKLSMKRVTFLLCILFAIATSFVIADMSGIHGTINPADGAKRIWAISGKDTVSGVASLGAFSLNVRPGNWKLLIETVKPYKDVVITNIIVEDGRYTNAGEIKLTKD